MSEAEGIYELYYWPFLPGRAEFVRLILEAAEAPYRDVARETDSSAEALELIMSVRNGSLGGTRPFAPPVLKHGPLVIAQTTVICAYLAERHGLVDESMQARLGAQQLHATLGDVTDEAHNTHHPISAAFTYEDQREAAAQAAQAFVSHRLGAFLEYFECVAACADSKFLLGPRLSYVDLALMQVWRGLEFAFPRAMNALCKVAPRLQVIVCQVESVPSVAGYLASDRRMAFNNDGVFRRYPTLDLLP